MNWRSTPSKLVALAVVVGFAGALSALGVSSAATTVSIEDSDGLAPSNLPKTKFAPSSLNVVVSSTTDTPEEFPTAVTHTQIDFDDDGKITTRGLAVCRRNLDNTTTEDARRMCRSSIVGQGTAEAMIPPGVPTEAVVTAFNGAPRGGNATIILHARTDVGITQVLRGTISKLGRRGDFGHRLTVPVPPLPAGAVLTRFETTVKKKWRHRGKTYNYITARCNDGNKVLNMRGTFRLAAEPTPQNSTDTQRCR
jgi:hypothetical protein